MIRNTLPDFMLEPLVKSALLEDLGRAGDITTDSLFTEKEAWRGAIVARQPGTLAGISLARLAFQQLDKNIKFTPRKRDGEALKSNDVIATVVGSARAILTAERVALNFLCHLSGIATSTHQFVRIIQPSKSRISCTRKTTPGLRMVEKYAVRAGGGVNHRFGLDDAILIKDNHIAAAGSMRAAVHKARENVGHLVKIEVEIDNLKQLREALQLPIDAVLLDNMDAKTLKIAVQMSQRKIITEASGGISLKNVFDIAASGVDIISIGWITHSAPALDIGLDEIKIKKNRRR